MTYKEAADVLDPETRIETLVEIGYYNGFNSDKAQSDAVNEACRIAAEVLRQKDDYYPLTLDELREMDGQPVWVKSLINDKPGEWCILRVVQMSKTWFLACSGSEQVFGDKDTYGETWLAYAYPPDPIDRSNWKLCFTCRSCTSCKNSTWLETDLNSPCRRCYGKNKYKPRNFCPDCGRPLTDEAWDMLEKCLMG